MLFAHVGQAATFTLWTDSYACTVIEVRKSGRELVLQRDKATLVNQGELVFEPGGFVGHVSGVQKYQYERNTDGERIVVSLRTKKDGSKVWKKVGQKTSSPGGVARLGVRNEHYDYNF